MSSTEGSNEGSSDAGRSVNKRREERQQVVLPARCRTRSGFRHEGVISDITSEGCRYESQSLHVSVGDMVVIKPDGLEGLCGRVRWIDRQSAGIIFETPLYGAVLDHLVRTHAHFLKQPEPGFQATLRFVA